MTINFNFLIVAQPKLTLVLKKRAFHFLLIFICLFHFIKTNAQSHKLDSIKTVLRTLELKNNATVKDTNYINALLYLASNYKSNKADTVLLLIKEIESLSKQLNYKEGLAKAYGLYSKYHVWKNDYTKSDEYFDKSVGVFENQSLTAIKNELALYSILGRQYSLRGDNSRALNYYFKYEDLAITSNRQEKLAHIYENIAIVYCINKDYEQGITFFEKGATLRKKYGDKAPKAQAQLNLARLYIATNDLDSAREMLAKNIPILEKNQDLLWVAYGYQLRGYLFLEEKNIEQALKWFNKSEEIYDKINEPITRLNNHLGLSKAHLALGDYDTALSYVNKAHETSKNFNALTEDVDILETFYKIYKQKGGELEKTLSYFEQFKKLSDSLNREENRMSLAIVKAEINYKKEREELIKKNEAALNKQKYVIYLVVGLLLIFILISILVKRAQNIQKNLNLELQQKNKLIQNRENELIESNNTKNRLFSIIGHDLRSPMISLQSLLSLFSSKAIEKDQLEEFLLDVNKSLDNVVFTLNNLLSWGKEQMRDSKQKPLAFNIGVLVDESVALLAEAAKHKNLSVENTIDDNAIVFADRDHIDIVIRNLINNAIKFTPEGGSIVLSSESEVDFWKIQIKDTGIGMTPEMIETLFKNQFNKSTYGTNDEKGTGIGIALCIEMLVKNNGKLWAESELEKGSTFYFKIPKKENSKD